MPVAKPKKANIALIAQRLKSIAPPVVSHCRCQIPNPALQDSLRLARLFLHKA
jgi:error-prone DNA polymerase